MKTVFMVCFAVSAFVTRLTVAGESVDEIANRFRTTILDTEMAHREIAQEIAASTPEQREQKIAAILKIVDKTLRASQSQSGDNDVLIMVSADVLRAVSADDAILAAFGSSLMRVGNRAQPAVVGALSVCRSPKATEMIAALARLRLQEAKTLLSQLPSPSSVTDAQRRTANNIMDSLFYALEGLARSNSESGGALARELRDECFKLFDNSPYQETIAEALKAEIDPLLQKTSKQAANSNRVSAPSSSVHTKGPKQVKLEKLPPTPSPDQKRTAITMWMAVAAVIGSILILGVFIWFLRKK